MMRGLFILLAALWSALPAQAQSPQVDLSMEEDIVIVGQPLIVRLSIMVPTFMPTPPVFPSFETPNLMVKLNGRATNPTSEKIDGETWSGVTRSFTFYPMISGTFQIPQQDVVVTYSDPATNSPVTETYRTTAFSFSATLPEGAKDLDPAILANSLEITQEITAGGAPLAVGDAITRSLKITVRGASPLFLPPLLDQAPSENLRGYPQDPSVSESYDRGVLSGTRNEQVSYIATQTGPAVLPQIQLSWYNLETEKVEVIQLGGATFEVEAGAAGATEPDWAFVAKIAAVLVFALAAFRAFWRYARAPVKAAIARRKSAYLQSEKFAYKQLKKAIAQKNTNQTIHDLALWDARTNRSDAHVHACLAALTATIYGKETMPGTGHTRKWHALGQAVSRARNANHKAARDRGADKLPDLNPY